METKHESVLHLTPTCFGRQLVESSVDEGCMGRVSPRASEAELAGCSVGSAYGTLVHYEAPVAGLRVGRRDIACAGIVEVALLEPCRAVAVHIVDLARYR